MLLATLSVKDISLDSVWRNRGFICLLAPQAKLRFRSEPGPGRIRFSQNAVGFQR
jgi:hypothetical protein